jgi:single-stranded-DNA-specific exonuclease
LTTRDPLEASQLALELDRENQARRDIEKGIVEDAIRKVESGPLGETIVLASQEWHHGVIGIVASRLVERFHRPTALVALEGDKGRGSARSVHGFHLFDAFSKLAPLFLRFGGHAVAAGFSIEEKQVPALQEGLNALAREAFRDGIPQKELPLELELSLSELDESLYEDLWRLAPFGQENPEPLLVARRVDVSSSRMVGRNHLKLQLSQGRSQRAAIGFGMGELAPLRGPIDVAFYAQRNSFRDEIEIELRLADLRPAL